MQKGGNSLKPLTPFLIFTVLVSTVAVTPIPAFASDYDAASCSIIASTMDDDIYLYTDDEDSDFAASLKEWQHAKRDALRDCSPHDRSMPIIDAALTMWHAWLIHKAERDYTTELEKAIQKLEGCTVTYYGTDDGAHCSNWQRKAIHWQTTWGESP